MTTKLRRRIVFMVAGMMAVFLVGAPTARAAEQRPLPAFMLTTLDGAPAPSDQLGMAGKWMVIYVTPTSPASARLLTTMKAWESPAMATRVVVVVGAPVAAAKTFASERARAFPAVRWFADPQGDAWKALRLTGTPFLLGIRDGVITWSLAGVLNDASTFESVVRSWIEPR